MIRLLERLRICDMQHGRPGNAASVYGHAVRTCIRIKGTNTWVYDPAWEGKKS
jgi:hypothetical protein